MSDEPLSPHAREPWKPVYRVLYRFAAAYVFLYVVFSLSVLLSITHWEFTQSFVEYDHEVFKHIVPWVAAHILRMPGPVRPSFTGDDLFEWVEQFVLLSLAVIGAALWWAADRRRPDYRVLDRWLRLLARLAMAGILFSYGFDKVFPNQFGSITRYSLIEQLGDLNHFGLLWSLMAASKGYTFFSGALEVLAGVMLLVPELASVGAFLAIAVLGNVVALNLAYNIPVKLFSTNLLLIAVYLAAPELPRLFNLLVRNRAVAPHPLIALSTNRRVDRGVKIAQVVLGMAFFATFFYTESHRYAETQKAASVPVPLQGIWLVDDFTVTGGSQSSLFTPFLTKDLRLQPGEERWTKLVFDAPKQMVIQTENGALDFVRLKLSEAKDEALLTDSGDAAWKADLKLQQPGPNLLNMQGMVNGVNVAAKLHKMDESRFRIRDEGLHLVQPDQ